MDDTRNGRRPSISRNSSLAEYEGPHVEGLGGNVSTLDDQANSTAYRPVPGLFQHRDRSPSPSSSSRLITTWPGFSAIVTVLLCMSIGVVVKVYDDKHAMTKRTVHAFESLTTALLIALALTFNVCCSARPHELPSADTVKRMLSRLCLLYREVASHGFGLGSRKTKPLSNR